ncbi:MAG: hypothetical protein IT452_01360 [Planctomycetia bacterium]|nr:hypothetical protein [Planctomycetia bacterium]
MSRTETVAVGLSVVAAVAAAIAALQARTTFADLSALSERVGKLESAPAPAPAAPAPGPSNADLSREISALRLQVAGLQARAGAADAGGKPPADPAAAAEARKQLENEQQKAWMETMTTRVVASLTEKLGLTAQQESQVRDLVTSQLGAFREARRGKPGEDTKKAVDDLLADTNAKIKSFLTPEQQEAYDRLVDRPGGIFSLPVQAGPSVNGGTVRPPGR